jgi:hypothetical protein
MKRSTTYPLVICFVVAVGSLCVSPAFAQYSVFVPETDQMVLYPGYSQSSEPPVSPPVPEWGVDRYEVTVHEPTFEGYRVDWCDRLGRDCGWIPAYKFCAQHFGPGSWEAGYTFAENIGAVTPTRTMTDNQVCDQEFCDGFESITCSVMAQVMSFEYPTYAGYPVDWCLNYGRDCGYPVAEALCETIDAKAVWTGGIASASWGDFGTVGMDPDRGRYSPTLTLGDEQLCDASYCDGVQIARCVVPLRDVEIREPVVDGYRVDWCTTWGQDCGGATAADQLCRELYGDSASAIEWESGFASPTLVLGDGRVCRGEGCRSFSSVTCYAPRTDNECNDGVNNDADHLIDYPEDPECPSPDADDEDPPDCRDGIDNDGDGFVDGDDPGCAHAEDRRETSPSLVCDDGLDNDGDGRIDYPDDPECAGPEGDREDLPECGDRVDNDGDGLVDGNDPGCDHTADPSERSALLVCDDGVDNDGDGRVDADDPDCGGPGDPSEEFAQIRIPFSGTLFSASGELAASFQVGEVVTGTVTLDLTIPDENPDPQRGWFSGATRSVVVRFAQSGLEFEYEDGSAQTFNDVEASPSELSDQAFFLARTAISGGLVDGTAVTTIEAMFFDFEPIPTSPTMLASDALPTNALQGIGNIRLRSGAGYTLIGFSENLVGADGVVTYPGPDPCDDSLQACIDAADPGDTVELATSRPIEESPEIDKSLTLRSAPGFEARFAEGHSIHATAEGDADAEIEIRELTLSGGSIVVRHATTGRLDVTIAENSIWGSEARGISLTTGEDDGRTLGTLGFDITDNQLVVSEDELFAGYGILLDPALASRYEGRIVENRFWVEAGAAGATAIALGDVAGSGRVDVIGNVISGRGYSKGVSVLTNQGRIESRIINNEITDQADLGGGHTGGIVAMPNGAGVTLTIVNNTLDQNDTGIAIHGGSDLGEGVGGIVANNLISLSRDYGLFIDPDIEAAVENRANLVFASGRDLFTPGPGTIFDDPRYGASGDYRLEEQSPAIDAGRSALVPEDVTADLAGETRIEGRAVDIGAYERKAAEKRLGRSGEGGNGNGKKSR